MWSSILAAILKLFGFGADQVTRAQDVKAGHDAAVVDVMQGESTILKEEIKGRAELQGKQQEIAKETTTEQARLRRDPNAIFREEK